MAQFKVAVIVGSNRRESINRKLAQALAKLGARALRVPIRPDRRSADVQPGQREPVAGAASPASRPRSRRPTALLFVTPEHNRSIPAVLKNAIDWGARPWGKNSWPGKPAAVTGTSRGAIGTAVAQQHLRQILGASGRARDGRRSLYPVQARADRRRRQRHRRERAQVPEGLHRPVRRASRGQLRRADRSAA